MIYHITAVASWKAAQETGLYRAPSLESEGFIHFSTAEQLNATANRFYKGCSGLVLLVVDESRLQSELRYEEASNHGTFPHLYGPLNITAVTEMIPLAPESDGSYLISGFQ